MLNMHRPSDQAKLLLFALLRGTVSSLATEPKVAAGGVGLAVKTAPILSSNIQLRLARKRDVAAIQRCNLATLPENYNSQFYVNHMRQWPDLCLVAEDTMGMEDNLGMEPDQPFGASFLGGSSKPEPNVVAYVLGKVEERPPKPQYSSYAEEFETSESMQQLACDQERFIGHVTSLAVLQPYRRKGLAAALMKQLHFHLEEAYGAGAVGLHVRKSNEAACRLYQNYGYQIDLTIPGYYQDGEDAYFMKKPLEVPSQLAMAGRSEIPKFPFLGRRPPQRPQPWESAPSDLRLPREVEAPPPPTMQEPLEQGHQGLISGNAW